MEKAFSKFQCGFREATARRMFYCFSSKMEI